MKAIIGYLLCITVTALQEIDKKACFEDNKPILVRLSEK